MINLFTDVKKYCCTKFLLTVFPLLGITALVLCLIHQKKPDEISCRKMLCIRDFLRPAVATGIFVYFPSLRPTMERKRDSRGGIISNSNRSVERVVHFILQDLLQSLVAKDWIKR